ncbi:protein PMR5 [Impatiens glandulifera]|uniref:protein PMR5 n=1 Tax=Impatiens glandulifera TaxID=253017 RepID=UPI001FB0F05D|nr:protein PMR5 [Impatiens glandulifera]
MPLAASSLPRHAFLSSILGTTLFLIIASPLQVSAVLLAGLKNHNSGDLHHRRPSFQSTNSCSIFVGNWVRDDSYPIYESSACPIIDDQFNCQLYGRPDSDYLKYRWRPTNCDLPRFDGVTFLTRMKGKQIMFVGDSLGRDQWESLICMISTAVPATQTQMMRGEPLSTFKFLDYGVTISYYKAPYLVDIDSTSQGKRVLRLGEISVNAKAWHGMDVLCFDTGHWWTHTGSLQGWDYMEWGGQLYEDMDRVVAMEKGMRTWATWVDANLDPSRTRLFFQSISPNHYNPMEWGAATRSCYGETEPMTKMGSSYQNQDQDQTNVVDVVIRDMTNPPYLLDITGLSAMRKDAHPSIYSGDLTPDQRANPDHSSDCSHWCLPGLPDTWNQLFYTALFFH